MSQCQNAMLPWSPPKGKTTNRWYGEPCTREATHRITSPHDYPLKLCDRHTRGCRHFGITMERLP